MENINSITKRLYEIADTFKDDEYFTLRLLGKEGFGTDTTTAIAILFGEGIDLISYNEAINVAKSDEEKKDIKQRRKHAVPFRINSQAPTYIPDALLKNPSQYCEILSNRDIYISVQVARKRLKLKPDTMARIITKRGLFVKKIQKERFIFVGEFKTVQAEIEGTLAVREARKKLNIPHRRFYRYANKMRININNGRIAKEDMERIASYNAIKTNEALASIISKSSSNNGAPVTKCV